MIEGHGDDAYKYKAIKINFSSNVYNHVDHSGLHQHLFQQMESDQWGYGSHLFNSSDIQESDFGYLDAHFQRICGCLSSAWS